MKVKLLSVSLLLFCYTSIIAENFRGYVKKNDSTSSAIFQAKVDVKEGDKNFSSYKTSFDGSFKFPLKKEQHYTVKIYYPGYTDTTYSFMSDKAAKAPIQDVVVKLKKDGMRLMGIIKSREEDFPVKDATIVLKNVMTRKEERITTDIDGKYNFKLGYETNYKVWIDKHSPGIFNKFQDTAFYISTVGFNQPLDYKLDIALAPAPDMPRPDNAAIKQTLKNLKTAKGDTLAQKKSVLKDTLATKEIAAVEEAKGNAGNHENNGKRIKTKKSEKVTETVVIPDTPPAKKTEDKTVDLLEQTRQKALIEQKAREDEKKIDLSAAQQKAEEEERQRQQQLTEEEARKQKQQQAQEEATKKEKEKRDLAQAAELLAKRLKFKQDSIQLAQTPKDSLVKAKLVNDTTVRAKAKPAPLSAGAVTKTKVSLPSVSTPTHKDSSAISKPVAVPKAKPDSVSKKTTYQPKTQEELIAAAEAFARRQKYLRDSLAKAKALVAPGK